MEKLTVWLQNLLNLPNLIMANYLRRHGWVAFYLDEQARHCGNDFCWLKLYQQEKA